MTDRTEPEMHEVRLRLPEDEWGKLHELVARRHVNAATVITAAINALHLIDNEVGIGGRQVRLNPKRRHREYVQLDYVWDRNKKP